MTSYNLHSLFLYATKLAAFSRVSGLCIYHGHGADCCPQRTRLALRLVPPDCGSASTSARHITIRCAQIQHPNISTRPLNALNASLISPALQAVCNLAILAKTPASGDDTPLGMYTTVVILLIAIPESHVVGGPYGDTINHYTGAGRCQNDPTLHCLLNCISLQWMIAVLIVPDSSDTC